MLNLGDRARDRITGFAGIITGRCEYLTGCDQVLINPGKLRDDKVVEGAWFDVSRVELTGEAAFTLDAAAVAEAPGGPQDDAPGRQEPRPPAR